MDKRLSLSEYTFTSDKIKKEESGYKIVQLSDLHDCAFGKDNILLFEGIKELSPDVVFVTGDVIDAKRTKEGSALSFLSMLASAFPVYYVPGNHEHRLIDFEEFLSKVGGTGVRVLRNECIAFGNFLLVGIDSEDIEKNAFRIKIPDNKKLVVAMAHKPHFLKKYAEYPIDLIFAGHAHGGQFRLPYIGGLFAPGQGIFPKYTCGKYRLKNTSMIVSRGLGNSRFPFRLNNKPDVVLCTLRGKS